MKMLSAFDHVFGVSVSSCEEFAGYVDWLGRDRKAAISPIQPGADFLGGERPVGSVDRSESATVLVVGILEPRKNQERLLRVCERLWADGYQFGLGSGRTRQSAFWKALGFGDPSIEPDGTTGQPSGTGGRSGNGRTHSVQPFLHLSVAGRRLRTSGARSPLDGDAVRYAATCRLTVNRRRVADAVWWILSVDDAWVDEVRILLEGNDAINGLALEAADRSLPIWSTDGEPGGPGPISGP